MKSSIFKLTISVFTSVALFLTLGIAETYAQTCTGDSGATGNCTAVMACTPAGIDGTGTCTDPEICCVDVVTPPGDGGTGNCSDTCNTSADCLDSLSPPNGICSNGICTSPTLCPSCSGDSGYVGTCVTTGMCNTWGKNAEQSCGGGNVCCTNAPPDENCVLTASGPALVGAFFQVSLTSDTPNTNYTVTTSPTCLGPTSVTTDASGNASFTKDCGPPAGAYTITAQAGAVNCSTIVPVLNQPGPACTGLGGASGYCVMGIGCPTGYIPDGGFPNTCTVDGQYCCVPEDSYPDFENRDVFTDAQKVNEYVSWYLNGTIGRAEYPPLNLNDRDDVTKLTSYSGPLNKRLPLAYIDKMKIDTIDSASEPVVYIDPATGLPDPTKTSFANHNQIVVCATHLISVGPIEIGPVRAHPCYPNPPGSAEPNIYRLVDWDDELSFWNAYANWVGNLVDYIASLHPLIPRGAIEDSVADHWNSRKPPLPWGEDQNGEPMSAIKYRKYYNEWRGNTCVIIPIFNVLLCFDNPFVTNEYADLFPWVPLANNTDKNALHIVSGVQMQPNPGTVACFSGDTDSCSNPVPPDQNPDPPANNGQLDGDNPDIVHEPVLYYPHAKEDLILSDALNETFTPSDCNVVMKPGALGVLVPGCEEYPTESNAEHYQDFEVLGCEFIETRSNLGDNLFQGSQDTRIDDLAVYVDIFVEKVGCPAGPIDDWIADCDCNWPSDCPTAGPCDVVGCNLAACGTCGTLPGKCRSYPSCDGSISLKIPTTPKIPYAEEIWESTVVGRESTFRRIFPKVEEGAPVNCIADMPGVTSTQYVPLPDPGYTPLVSIETPPGTTLHIPHGAYGVTSSELYFPYQGTIYEYFLRGIQTALRPKGFGHPIPNGTECGEVCGELPEFGEIGDCQLKGTDVNGVQIPPSFAEILEAAGFAYKVPPSLIAAILYGEGAFNQPPQNSTGKGYDWTDPNVLDWASCTGLPNCSDPTTSLVGFLPGGFEDAVETYDVLEKLKEFDPEITEVDPCNLWHVVFVISAMIRTMAGGNNAAGGISGESCYGIEMGSYIPVNCQEWYQGSRGDSMMETAIRAWEFGTWYDPASHSSFVCPYGAGNCNCATISGGCALGGAAAGCDKPGDACEKRGATSSHNGCLWDIAH